MVAAEAVQWRQRQLQRNGDGGAATVEAAVSTAAVDRWGRDNMAAVAAARRWPQRWQNGGGGGSATATAARQPRRQRLAWQRR
jgi:hypothetical protein